MVTLATNTPEFFADIADELRLFLPGEVRPEPGGEVSVALRFSAENGVWHALASCTADGETTSYEYACPALAGGALAVKREKKRAVKIAAFRVMNARFDAYTPWGSLTGIRPTRLLRELAADMGEAEALAFMGHTFDVAADKASLLRETAAVQAGILDAQTPQDMDVYVGIPFCKTRCLYCSFLSAVRTDKTDMAAYIAALKKDIELGADTAAKAGYRIRAMYMGGGTPTVLTAEELHGVLAHALACYGGFGRELTVEAGRPDTITEEKLDVLRMLGVTRISVNPQSMNPETLTLIGRSHTPEDIANAMALSRRLGFDSINMDVIAGLPGETERHMENTLLGIAALAPESLTVHTLALKRSSALVAKLDEYPLPDARTADAMVAMGRTAAKNMGMKPYYMYRQKYMRGNLENVGYALPGAECVYNVDIMEETTSIMAHGAGAMTKRIFPGEHRVERIPNPKDIATYINKLDIIDGERRRLFGI